MNSRGEGREPEDGGSVQKNEWGQEFEACHFLLARGTKEQSAGFKHLNYQESQNGATSGGEQDTSQLSSCTRLLYTHIKRLNFGL